MGTKIAPAYANIFIGRLGGQLLRSVALRLFSWLRFIDDIDMKWSHGHDILTTFLDEANSFHPSIKFIAEISTKQHVFLDTKSSLVGNTISADLYTKPTDTHQYLVPKSCHPKHCCKNVPYSLALRLKRICSDSDTFESRARELTDHLCKGGYQKQAISFAIERARQKKTKDLLFYRPKSDSSVLPFVLTYHPDLPKVRNKINKHWTIIESSSTLSEVFTERATMAYRRPKSLRNPLVRAKLKPDMHDDEPLGETRPCGKAKCKTCKMITPTQIPKSAYGATIKLRCNTSCKTTNVVYLITCTKFGKQYVGETGNHVNQWMNGHRDVWKHKRLERSPVAEHLFSPEHDFLNHAALCYLDHNLEWTDRTRKARESYWIRRLNTLRPFVFSRGNHRSFVRACDMWSVLFM